MSILARAAITHFLQRQDDPLVVTPLLAPADQIGDASVDVRLGNEFILLRKRDLSAINLAQRHLIRSRIAGYQEKVRIEYQRPLTLHPNQLVLGATLEYVKLPADLGCYLIGRSSWGRLGLVIETASAVAPGFRGCITLELVNVGEVPLVLYPGVRIAQLVFHTVRDGESDYSGKYVCATGPQFSRVHDDSDLEYWCPVASVDNPDRSTMSET